MLILIKLIGVVIAVMGIIYILSPKVLKHWVSFWSQGKRLYIGGILSLLFGIFFLVTASRCRFPGVIIALGIISLLKGIILIGGLERTKSMLRWWDRRSSMAIRFMGLIAIGIGVLLLYSI